MSAPALSIVALARMVNRPLVTLTAVALAIGLGMMQVPFLDHLRPFGEFYIALLQMCVLPFLLTTIPLAVRSAMTSGTVGRVVRLLVIWMVVAIGVVAVATVLITTQIFHYFAIDEGTLGRIGALVGGSTDRVDVEFALDPGRAGVIKAAGESGLLAVVPTNIFASLASNDSMRVLVFAAIFGIAMVTVERQSGHSVFAALRHIQVVCILIFDWFSLLVPIGIVALIAPQVALMGSEIFSVLALLCYAFFAASAAVVVTAILVVSIALRRSPFAVFGSMLKPIMLGAATRNTLVCIPVALDTMKADLRVANGPCDLFIPVGFATMRFGIMLYFIVATLFMGTLMGRTFSPMDLVWVALLSTAASFATLGVTGLAALAPLAAVLRQFGLSYEVAVPLMIIIDPIANMVRVMVNVAVNCAIPALAGGRDAPAATPAVALAPAE